MNIADIARMAGVSNAAVSRYFNNGYLSEEKREQIRRVVEETGYRPSVQAQTLRTRRTRLIGVVLPKINSPSVGSVVAGILSVLNKNGYQMLLANTENNPQRELEYLATFNKKQVDGILFVATVFTPEHKRLLKSISVPLVIIGQRLPGYHCVYHDDYHATYELTRLFLGKGCRHLGYIGVLQADRAAGQSRYQGYCDAVREAGLPHLAENVVIGDFTLHSGYDKCGELLNRCGMLEGILCATDTMALGASRSLWERGIRVPGQILLAGQGDSEVAQLAVPSITTVHYSYEGCGKKAAEMILELLEKPELETKEIMLAYRIVERHSTMG